MAGSRNAFAAAATAQRRSASILTEQDGNARSRKRVRLSEDGFASINTLCVQADTSLEVDHMILDYVAYQTISACFASQSLGPTGIYPSLSNSVATFNAFLSIFKTRHSQYLPDAELRLRLLLLKLIALFTQRMTSNPTTPDRNELLRLRAANQERTRTWIGTSERVPSSAFDTSALDEFSLPRIHLERNRAHVLHELGLPAEDEAYEDAFYGTSSCVSLLDILPQFMEVSAARNAMSSSSINEFWMHLACEFMTQACLEQYLVLGATGSDAINEAFAWGHRSVVDGGTGISVEINAMFEDEDHVTEVEGWQEQKSTCLERLLRLSGESPDQDGDMAHLILNLETLASQHPVAVFETSLLKFLQAISSSIAEPVLVQLENGRLDGMSDQQTRDFLADCGIVGVAGLLEVRGGSKVAVE